jgi:circadian clock protein KaiC
MKYLLRSPLQNPQTSPPPGGSTNHHAKSPKKSGASTEEQDTEDMDTDNLLEMLWQPPTEDIIDVLAERLIETVRQRGVRRLFIDGLAGFQNTTASPERLNGLFSTILTTLRTMDVTTIWAVELADLFTADIVMPELVSKMAAQVENIMLLRHVELYSQLYRLISIMKMRQSGYDPSIREFRITDYGLDVASTFTSAESILTGIARPREAPQVSAFGISGPSVQKEQ